MNVNQPKNLAILLFDDVELLDFCGPLEVLSVANRFSQSPTIHLCTVAQQRDVISTRSGLSVNPDHAFADCPKPDVLLVPGGKGTRAAMKNDALVDWIRTTAEAAETVLSVCTGALLLGRAGLLDGLEVTTHHTAFGLLREIVPTATVLEDRRYVDQGRIITSAGIAAGMDMSLHFVARTLGAAVASDTAKQMEYPYTSA